MLWTSYFHPCLFYKVINRFTYIENCRSKTNRNYRLTPEHVHIQSGIQYPIRVLVLTKIPPKDLGSLKFYHRHEIFC